MSDDAPLAVPLPAVLSGRLRRRRRRGGGAREVISLNVIPLIDIVFFLLVFYVVSTSFSSDAAVGIERPESGSAQAVSQGFVAVAVVRSGAVFVGPRPVATGELSAVVRQALREHGGDRVLLRADRAVPTGTLLAVMDACRAGGAVHVDVAAVRTSAAETP